MEQFKNSAEQEPDLGRVILEQKIRSGTIGNAIFLLIVALPLMLVILAEPAPIGIRLVFFTVGLGLTVFTLWMLWRHWMRVYLHEHGIREFRQGRGRSLLYEQVDQLIYSSLRIFMNGLYIHTIQKLALKSDSMPDPPLVCTHIFKEADGRAPAEARTPVVEVRDSVSRALAARLAKALSRENSLEWTEGLRVSATGLEISEANGAWELVEWQRVNKAAIGYEILSMWVDADVKPRLQVPTNIPNFYPIWLLITQLRLKAAQAR